jgi:hypothetical protein
VRITLAYPYKKHQADETVEVDDATARLLIREGRARLAPPAHKPAPADVGSRTKEA